MRWAAIHGRRLLAGCGAKGDDSAAGRLVLLDLDDSSTNAGQRNPGVGSSPLDALCGLIGTGTGAGSNGIPEQMGWVGVGKDLIGLDLELEHATTQQRPLRTMVTVRISERVTEEIQAVVPTLGVCGLPQLSAAVATSRGEVCVVDLGCWHQGVEPTDETIIHRWEVEEPQDEYSVSSLAAVPAANALVHAFYCGDELNILRVLDPRNASGELNVLAAAGNTKLAGCPPILDMFSPPDSSVPMVLAAIDGGGVLSIDLRMLDRPWTEWPVVVAAEAGGGPPVMTLSLLTGGAQTLLAACSDGALVGIFGSRSGGGAAAGDGAEEGEEAEVDYRERMKQVRSCTHDTRRLSVF